MRRLLETRPGAAVHPPVSNSDVSVACKRPGWLAALGSWSQNGKPVVHGPLLLARVPLADADSSPTNPAMRDFDDSTLWRISAYERFRAENGHSGFAHLNGSAVLPTTLASELTALENKHLSGDVIEVLAACIRKRESALILLRHRDLLWPLTVFPRNSLYHLPRPIIDALDDGNRDMEVMALEPPGLRPPGHAMHERIADGSGYLPLAPLLWALALKAPRARLLDDIAGRVAYRVSADFLDDGITLAGALSPALRRLRLEIATLDQIARWPGMDKERAARVLNGVYLQGGLIVLRSHRLAQQGQANRFLGWLRSGH